MTTSNERREEIARVLHRQATDDGEVHVLWAGIEGHEEEVAEWLPFADALMAAFPQLADTPADAETETGVRMEETTDADLDRLEVLAMKATPGPWLAQYEVADEQFCVTGAGHFDGGRWLVCPEVATLERGGEDDAAFIEAARTAVPELIARVRELEQRLAIKEGADAPLTALPALAGVTDEMVETGAQALFYGMWDADWAAAQIANKNAMRYRARVVLEAVIGKEQADERG